MHIFVISVYAVSVLETLHTKVKFRVYEKRPGKIIIFDGKRSVLTEKIETVSRKWTGLNKKRALLKG